MRAALVVTGLILTASGALAHNDHGHHHHSHGEAQQEKKGHHGNGGHSHDHKHDHDHDEGSLGAHVHGQANLQLALEGTGVDLFFSSPAVNLLGFEHRPETDAQKEALDKAMNYFREMALVHPANGDCQVVSATVETPLADADFEGSHGDITVSQTLECSSALAGSRVQANVMTDWPDIESLQLQWLGDGGQGSQELTQGQQQFRP
ncbi:MAG: DUF2796 domain-containing protein [Halomonadaceae bacterium]|nr:MAG: DUF2796 domain-containing protein [Halomonadaceae bacterium]